MKIAHDCSLSPGLGTTAAWCVRVTQHLISPDTAAVKAAHCGRMRSTRGKPQAAAYNANWLYQWDLSVKHMAVLAGRIR